MPVEIREARTEADYAIARRLIEEYVATLGVDLSFQNFATEIAHLAEIYGTPRGQLLLAFDGSEAVGCVALRRVSDDVCEMKRLYVTPQARGSGLGRRLAVAIIELAGTAGYRQMLLDTLASMQEARALYRALGFRPTEPYYENPLPGTAFLVLTIDIEGVGANGGVGGGRGGSEEATSRDKQPGIVLVEATSADAAAIAALHAASWRTAYRGMLPDAFLDGPIDENRHEMWQRRLSLATPPYVLKAILDEALVGFACVFGGADPTWGALLDNLHVLPEAKGRGIGARLLHGAREWVRRSGRDRRMHLWVFEANTRARGFYDHEGGRTADHRTLEIIPGTRVPEVRYYWESQIS